MLVSMAKQMFLEQICSPANIEGTGNALTTSLYSTKANPLFAVPLSPGGTVTLATGPACKST